MRLSKIKIIVVIYENLKTVITNEYAIFSRILYSIYSTLFLKCQTSLNLKSLQSLLRFCGLFL